MGEKYAKNKVFLNLKRNLVINIITWICSITKIYIVWCVPVQMLCLEKCYFWDMVQNAPSQCNCKIFKSTVSQGQIDVTDSFFACYYKFMKIKSWLKIYWSGMFTCSLFWISVTWLISWALYIFPNISLYFPQYSTVLADNCFPEVLGEPKSKVKKVVWSEIVQLIDDPDMLHFKCSYDSDFKRWKFKTTKIRHVEMNRTAKRKMYSLMQKGIPKQHHAFFNSPTVTTSGGRMILILTVILTVRKMNLLIQIKIG